jgi:small-conductance mechanosensitive channel
MGAGMAARLRRLVVDASATGRPASPPARTLPLVNSWFQETFGFTEMQGRLLQTALLLLGVLVVRWAVLRVVHRRIDDAQIWFRTRKYATYAAFTVTVLVLIDLWLGGIGGALTYVGIVSAGLAVALADVLKNLAGWAYIVLRRPFRVGDRVELGDHRGDVVDIRVFRFTMLEIGNWVEADQSTGRLVHVPNGLVFTDPILNYTEGFPFIWDELGVLVTFESDWELGERLLRQILEVHAPNVDERRMGAQLREAAQEYFIRYTHLQPTVYVSVEDSGVMLTARFLVPARERRGVRQSIWRALLHALAENPSVELAYPTVRTFLPDPLQVRSRPETPGG